MAGELIKASGRYEGAFRNYEALLRGYVGSKQKGAERFSVALTPRTRWGLFMRNQVIKASTIPGLARLAFGRDIIDKLSLPDYRCSDRSAYDYAIDRCDWHFGEVAR